MPDSTINAIDRLFDFVDRGVESLDRVFNRAKYTEEQHRDRRANPDRRTKPSVRVQVIEGARKPKPAFSTTALTRKPRFYIVEAGALFVVTDGGSARAECSTRAMADKILRALETA